MNRRSVYRLSVVMTLGLGLAAVATVSGGCDPGGETPPNTPPPTTPTPPAPAPQNPPRAQGACAAVAVAAAFDIERSSDVFQ